MSEGGKRAAEGDQSRPTTSIYSKGFELAERQKSSDTKEKRRGAPDITYWGANAMWSCCRRWRIRKLEAIARTPPENETCHRGEGKMLERTIISKNRWPVRNTNPRWKIGGPTIQCRKHGDRRHKTSSGRKEAKTGCIWKGKIKR